MIDLEPNTILNVRTRHWVKKLLPSFTNIQREYFQIVFLEILYPGHFETRKVNDGCSYWKNQIGWWGEINYFALYGSRNRRENSGDFSVSENHTFCK
ncbi:hypothetical protein LEP1GSC188_3021 [Leptospira weilii serovar Topaz str. LT2116]|uniref:Uncharacterized protein n=1 Tax=Leptospira weilii serovar Topaz str. LT2116 TaxID=1088540 RepID=M3EP36_9LEPT|nr:hypothetical protein LEP1GSC188_3021 [Leptospira weilii serovar Topaz str. LT2116]